MSEVNALHATKKYRVLCYCSHHLDKDWAKQTAAVLLDCMPEMVEEKIKEYFKRNG